MTEAAATTPGITHGKIALEEHYLPEHLVEYWEGTVTGMPKVTYDAIKTRLFDCGALRIEEMDAAGIARSILSVAGPGVQIEPDTALAIGRAQQANDDLAARVSRHPDRFSGFAHLALQDPTAAANELERCVKDLKFCGALINGQTLGHYLDETRFDVFWERAQDLGVPIYLHPADPERTYCALEGQRQLRRPTWEWTVETATHALRMVFNGTFDRYPGARLVLGHMGETLPYLLWRFDSRALLYRPPGDSNPLPSSIIKRNIKITISGVFDDAPLTCALTSLGEDNIMFAADYPFEDQMTASRFLDRAAVSDVQRGKIAHGNAARLLKL